MEYRIIHNTTGVTSFAQHTETSITRTTQQVFIGEVEDCINFCRRKNIDYNLIIEDQGIIEEALFDVPISDILISGTPKERKVSVLTMPIDFSSRVTYSTMKISYQDLDLNEISKHYTFKIANDFILNEGTENEMGEFDYFYDLVINQGLSLKSVITNKILEMDSRQVFDSL